jgi:hypothetical protein
MQEFWQRPPLQPVNGLLPYLLPHKSCQEYLAIQAILGKKEWLELPGDTEYAVVLISSPYSEKLHEFD